MSAASGECWITTDGVTLRYQLAGTGPVLAVQAPAWGTGVGYLENTLVPLQQHFTMLYVDPRGSAGSPAAPDRPIHIGAVIEDLEHLREHLGFSRIHLLGHSHGAYTAMNYALAYPSSLASLILVAPELGPDALRRSLARSRERLKDDPRYIEALQAWFSPDRMQSAANFAAWFQRTSPLHFHDPSVAFRLWEQCPLASIPPETVRACLRSDRHFAVRTRLSQITTRTLVLVGRHDHLTEDWHARIIHRRIPRAELEILEQSGHLPWLEEPERFFSLVRDFILACAEDPCGLDLPVRARS